MGLPFCLVVLFLDFGDLVGCLCFVCAFGIWLLWLLAVCLLWCCLVCLVACLSMFDCLLMRFCLYLFS